MKIILLFLAICFVKSVFPQNEFKAVAKDSTTNETLIGVNAYISRLNMGAASDLNGRIVINNIPNGTYIIVFSYVGYKNDSLTVSFPYKNESEPFTVLMQPRTVMLNQIIVSSTRTENRIENTPVRVEVLGPDEVNEEFGIKPGNISKLLGETSGVLLQQTSAASGNVAFRIQGLPAQYTQLLSDGFPVYSGFSSGLSLLQIPPLNLQQVEVVKGSASTLYGGDAISGIVNLITKKPAEKPELSFLLNQTQKGETDFSGYYSGRNKKLGLTFLTDYNIQKAVDVDHDGFTDIPEFQQANITPKLFYYINNNQTLTEQLSFSYDHRKGGDFLAVTGSADSLHTYLLENKSVRLISELKYNYNFSNGNVLTFKNSLSSYYRKINSLSNIFAGNQFSTYSELSYLINTNSNRLVIGANLVTDDFAQKDNPVINLSYNNYTSGLFIMDNWEINKSFIWQNGLRADYNNVYHTFVLPQSFLLYKINNNLSVRAGGGAGYKLPTIFTNEAEDRIFKDVLPITADVNAEKSSSLSLDFNYKTILFKIINLNFDQSFYYTKVTNPVLLGSDSLSMKQMSNYYYYNSSFDLVAKGFDTNLHLSMDDIEFYFEYTFTDAEHVYPNYNSFLQLTPKHKINITLTMEDENNWRTGFEAFYTGKEFLDTGSQSPDYWTIGVMFQKYFQHFSIIANVENLFDVRQSKYGPIYNPPINNPTFDQLYAPLDGRVANIAVKIDL
jgi:outer membrane receptor for ferrienterochelin and colicins